MIVVDTNVIAYLLLPCEQSAAADRLFAKDPDWAAPVLWRSEFRNVLAGYLRRRTIAFDDAISLQGEAERLLAGREYEVDSRRVLGFVRDSRCSAYDCEFVALASDLDVPLVSMDARLLEAFPRLCRRLAA